MDYDQEETAFVVQFNNNIHDSGGFDDTHDLDTLDLVQFVPFRSVRNGEPLDLVSGNSYAANQLVFFLQRKLWLGLGSVFVGARTDRSIWVWRGQGCSREDGIYGTAEHMHRVQDIRFSCNR